MPHPPLVSIVTIFLNEERFLQEAIDSVIAQTSDRWELLLIDDGSTDRSREIAQRSARAQPNRIRYLSHAGRRCLGKSASRNLGLLEAHGEYVTFLDGDDVFRSEKIARQAAILDREAVAMVYGPTLYWRQWSGASPDARPDSLGRLGVNSDRIYPPPELLKLFLRDGGIVPCICGLTVRRSVALEIGGFDAQIEHLYEDQVFLAKVCANFPVYVESGCWDLYRQHDQSSSHLAIADGSYHPVRSNPSHRLYLAWLDDHLMKLRTIDPELRAALNHAWWPYRHPALAAWREGLRRMRRRISRTMARLTERHPT